MAVVVTLGCHYSDSWEGTVGSMQRLVGAEILCACRRQRRGRSARARAAARSQGAQ